MNFLKLVKTGALKSAHFMKKNLPTILTIAGAGGAVASVVLAVKATPKAMKLIEERKERENKEKLTALETVDACWKEYAFTGVTLTVAVACVIGANFLHLKGQAALLGLYSAQSEMFKEYKKKMSEIVGAEQETEVRKELVQEKLKNDPRIINFTPILDGEVPVYDELTGQILSSTRERLDLKILQGEKEGNGWDGMSVNEWLLILGARRMKMGDDSGWNERTGFEVCVETIEVDHRIPCYYLNYLIPPKEDFR